METRRPRPMPPRTMAPRLMVLVGMAAMAAGASAAGAQGFLYLPGEFHGDEVAVETGREVTGLFRAPDGSALLAPTTLRVEAVRDVLVDAEGEATGKAVSAAGPGEALFFVAGLELDHGPVTQVSSERRPMPVREPLELSLDGRLWTLGVECAGARGRDLVDCAVVLTGPAGSRQTLARYPEGTADSSPAAEEPTFVVGDNWPTLLWAGDLDRDGRLDLLFDRSDHYNVTDRVLYLSSRAAEGELVHPAATCRTVGC